MSKRGRRRIYENLDRITVGLTFEERKRLDELCDKMDISRHEYLSACLASDSDGVGTTEADLKEKAAEVLSLKGKLDRKHGEVETLKEKVAKLEEQLKKRGARFEEELKKKSEKVAKLEERLKKRESKISDKDAKMQVQTEDLRRRCEKLIAGCKANVGAFWYERGRRDEYHEGIMADLASEYRLLKIKGGDDEYLERELEKWIT